MEVKITEAQLFEKIGRLQVEAEIRAKREESLIEMINQLRAAQQPGPEPQAESTPLKQRVRK